MTFKFSWLGNGNSMWKFNAMACGIIYYTVSTSTWPDLKLLIAMMNLELLITTMNQESTTCDNYPFKFL